jgi:hypothetical protein
MKRRFFATLSSLTLFTAAGAFAQSTQVLKADIPFEFHVGGKTLPAGTYHVRPQIQPGILSIRSAEGEDGAVVQTNGGGSRRDLDTGKLVFTRYEDTYFLSMVWTPGYEQGRELPKSKMERELAREKPTAAMVRIVLTQR